MIAEMLYRALLLAYPEEHRQQYGEPMVQLFRDRMRRDRGGLRTLVVWMQMIFDLVRSATRERQEQVMFEGVTGKKALVNSGRFLIWSLVATTMLYMITICFRF